MIKRSTIAICFIFSVFYALAGCSLGQDKPKEVAVKFWEATKSGDPAKIKPFVTQASLANDLMKNQSAQDDQATFILGEEKIDGDKATIPTVIQDQNIKFELTTVLLKEDGKWKVDVTQTMTSMLGGALGEMMKGIEQIGDQVGKELDDALKDFGEQIQKVVPPGENAQEAPSPALSPRQEILEAMDILEGRTNGQNKDTFGNVLGGIEKTIHEKVSTPFYVINGGIQNNINLEVTAPITVITYGGNKNKITVTKGQAFEGNIEFVRFGGLENEYSGGPIITFEEYRNRE